MDLADGSSESVRRILKRVLTGRWVRSGHTAAEKNIFQDENSRQRVECILMHEMDRFRVMAEADQPKNLGFWLE